LGPQDGHVCPEARAACVSAPTLPGRPTAHAIWCDVGLPIFRLLVHASPATGCDRGVVLDLKTTIDEVLKDRRCWTTLRQDTLEDERGLDG
jgi:hypothetical protein